MQEEQSGIVPLKNEQFAALLLGHAQRCPISKSERAQMVEVWTAAWMDADDQEELYILKTLREFNSRPGEAEMLKQNKEL